MGERITVPGICLDSAIDEHLFTESVAERIERLVTDGLGYDSARLLERQEELANWSPLVIACNEDRLKYQRPGAFNHLAFQVHMELLECIAARSRLEYERFIRRYAPVHRNTVRVCMVLRDSKSEEEDVHYTPDGEAILSASAAYRVDNADAYAAMVFERAA